MKDTNANNFTINIKEDIIIIGDNMNKKGFTLIEVLAAITLIAAILVVLVPTIINQINKNKKNIEEKTTTLIDEAAYTYIDLNPNVYPAKVGNVYCIKLQTLVNYDYLKEPVINPTTKKEYNLEHYVKATFETEIDINYSIVSSCTEIKN